MKTSPPLLALLLAGAALGQAEKPFELPGMIISASLDAGQVFDAPSPRIYGGTASIYGEFGHEEYCGAGFGFYSQEDRFAAEFELKYSYTGIVGGGLGIALKNAEAALMTDLWANAVFIGIRFRTVFASTGINNSVMVFVPLTLPLGFLILYAAK